MTEEDIIDKVRKLLRLGKSANEHEAQLALEHALRLAAKHKLDLNALALDPELERIIDQRFPVGQRLSFVAKEALSICISYFNVEAVITTPNVVFFGTPSDVAIAHYVFGYVSAACRRCLREFERAARRKRSLNQRRNFITGFFWGLHSHLGRSKDAQLLEDSKLALILSDGKSRREAYKQTLFPRTKTLATPKMRKDRSAIYQGFLDGKNTTINPAINCPSATLLLT